MKRRRVLFIQSSQLKIFFRRLLIVLIFIFASFLMVLSKANNVHLSKTEYLASKIFYPILYVIKLPIDGASFVYQKVDDIIHVYSLNNTLKTDLKKVEILQRHVEALKKENKELSSLLNYIPTPEIEFVTAKVISAEGDGFFHSLVVYIGNNQKIKKGQVVLNQGNVIGRIDTLLYPYARVLLISDINSKIPVIIERNKTRGILSGNNTETLNLLFTEKVEIKEKDKVLTSGVGGVFPGGLKIGYVSKIKNGEIEVKPFKPIETIEYVQIVDYGLSDDILKEDI